MIYHHVLSDGSPLINQVFIVVVVESIYTHTTTQPHRIQYQSIECMHNSQHTLCYPHRAPPGYMYIVEYYAVQGEADIIKTLGDSVSSESHDPPPLFS